jgi:hypothetical protein
MTSRAWSPRRQQEEHGVVAASARRRAVRRGECSLDLVGRQHHGHAGLLVRPNPRHSARQVSRQHATEHQEAE